MTKENYEKIEAFLRLCASGGAHDAEHSLRVLFVAMEIAETEEAVDIDVLIAACLLHDIGRAEQKKDPSVCHAAAGAEKAYRFLMAEGFGEDFAAHVKRLHPDASLPRGSGAGEHRGQDPVRR